MRQAFGRSAPGTTVARRSAVASAFAVAVGRMSAGSPASTASCHSGRAASLRYTSCCRWPNHARSFPVTLGSRTARSAATICSARASGSEPEIGGSARVAVAWGVGVAVATMSEAVGGAATESAGGRLDTEHAVKTEIATRTAADRVNSSAARTRRALEEQIALARVLGERCSALEFRARFVRATELLQQVAARARQEVVRLERRLGCE